MDGGIICPCLSLDCSGCKSGITNGCVTFCNAEPTLSVLPVWKRELIRKKRLSNGVGSSYILQGISACRLFRVVNASALKNSSPLALLDRTLDVPNSKNAIFLWQILFHTVIPSVYFCNYFPKCCLFFILLSFILCCHLSATT